MKITKPKRQSNGTYVGNIYKKDSEPITMKIKDAYIFAVKQVNRNMSSTTDDSEPSFYLSFKQSLYNNTFCDINAQILEIVKDNCNSWFKVSLTNDIIEDYFINNVFYDKNKGEYIRIKCINDISQVPINVVANLEISLQHIRFYKQQFVLEWMLDEVEIIEGKSTEEEDIPAPSPDDIKNIKGRVISAGESLIKMIDRNVEFLWMRAEYIKKALGKLKDLQDVNQVLMMEDGLDELSDVVKKYTEVYIDSSLEKEVDGVWNDFKNKFSLT